MADSASPGEMPPALARPVTVSELRAHLAEMIGRAERGRGGRHFAGDAGA